jgi:uncharacterized membrane protein YcaP (DUF421 family)
MPALAVVENCNEGASERVRDGVDSGNQRGIRSRHVSPPWRHLMSLAGLWTPDVDILEKILRAAAVYVFLLTAFRLSGKRQIGQLTPFDLVVLLVISNIVQNAMIGNDNSLGGGIIGATTILALNWAVVELTFRFKPLRRLVEARPTVLIHDGRILHDRLRAERITMDDLEAALRRGGVADPTRVRFAVLEESGGISVVPFSEGAAPPSGDRERA